MPEKPFAAYAERNGGPILGVLKLELAGAKTVLEIGSGTGQHAVRFAHALPHLRWQTSDLEENLAGISAWVGEAGLPNLLPPLQLDVRESDLKTQRYDAVYSSNTAHIMDCNAVQDMVALVGTALTDGGVFVLYGPFRQNGRFNTDSNEAFDRDLRARDAEMGIRDIEDLDRCAAAAGLRRLRLYAMPANNYIAVWQKTVHPRLSPISD